MSQSLALVLQLEFLPMLPPFRRTVDLFSLLLPLLFYRSYTCGDEVCSWHNSFNPFTTGVTRTTLHLSICHYFSFSELSRSGVVRDFMTTNSIMSFRTYFDGVVLCFSAEVLLKIKIE